MVRADSRDKFESRKKVACFKIRITASRKVKYTPKVIEKSTKDQILIANTGGGELER